MQDPLKYPHNFVGLFAQVLMVARFAILAFLEIVSPGR